MTLRRNKTRLFDGRVVWIMSVSCLAHPRLLTFPLSIRTIFVLRAPLWLKVSKPLSTTKKTVSTRLDSSSLTRSCRYRPSELTHPHPHIPTFTLNESTLDFCWYGQSIFVHHDARNASNVPSKSFGNRLRRQHRTYLRKLLASRPSITMHCTVSMAEREFGGNGCMDEFHFSPSRSITAGGKYLLLVPTNRGATEGLHCHSGLPNLHNSP